MEGDQFWQDVLLGPGRSKYDGELLDVFNASLSNRVNGIFHPVDADRI